MSDGRARLSGCQYKKRRIEKETERKKQAGALNSFLKKGVCSSLQTTTDVTATTCIDIISTDNTSTTASTSTATTSIATTSTVTTSTSTTSCETALQISYPLSVSSEEALTVETTNSNTILTSDPATWPERLQDGERIFLVKKGPSSPLYNYEFPHDNQGRRFNSRSYKRKLNNGEEFFRDWLVYSTTKNAVYCFCCKIFNINHSSLSKDGYTDWKHLSDVLTAHETSKKHVEVKKSWYELARRLRASQTIDVESQRIINSEINHWNDVFMRIVSIIKMLGKSGLAFQGKTDKLYQNNNGNFLKLIELLAEFDPVMEEHVRRVLKKKEKGVSYLSKNIQNELINIISDNIRQHILKEVKKSKYYSIILDCTPDASKTEQMTIIIRYVFIDHSDDHSKTADVTIKESFLGFVPIEKSSGLELTDVLLERLDTLGLSLQDMRGQGYDNGSNMKGVRSGVQARIKNMNPRAFFVPCSSHSLNLVVNDMAKSSLEAANFFNMVQKIYVFFSSSTLRWSILLKNVDGLTLKPLSDTRWESRIDAIKPLRSQIGQIYDALFSIYEDSFMDTSTRDEASGLLTQIKQFKFLCSVVIWYETLNRINPVSKLMQSKNFALSSVIPLLKSTKLFFENSRTDEFFNQVMEDAKKLALEINSDTSFYTSPNHRVRSKKRQFNYECRDEPIVDPKEKYKIEVFFCILDTAINSLDLRFTQMNEHSSYFAFLYNIYDLREMPKNELLEHCKNLENILRDADSLDISGIDLADELSVLSFILEKKLSPEEVLKIIIELDFGPNVNIALRILLTLPVTVASGERSFSKLKLIKNYLRSTMSQERTSALAMISIEHEVCNAISIANITRDFAEKKVRKKIF